DAGGPGIPEEAGGAARTPSAGRPAGGETGAADFEALSGDEIRGNRHGPQVRGRDGQSAGLPGDARATRPVLRTQRGKSIMNCERIREQIPEALAGRLDAAARETLVEHLESCAGCRSE